VTEFNEIGDPLPPNIVMDFHYEPRAFLMFHWSPSTRRKGIGRLGMVPGKWSTDRMWKPPYVAFAPSPSLAWALSAATHRGQQVPSWDLWMTDSTHIDGGFETIPFDDNTPDNIPDVKEFRVYDRIYKRDLWFIGTRTHAGDKAEYVAS
jgi:hypothetical protein